MKPYRLLPIIALTFSLATATAQIPNSGFESWVDQGGYLDPADWLTDNSIFDIGGPVYTVEQGTPGAAGNYHALITTKALSGGSVIQGWMSAGSTSDHAGFPCTDRPAILTGLWQFGIQPDDTAQVTVALSKWNSSTLSTEGVALGVLEVTGSLANWQTFTVPLTYLSTGIPDTAYIQILSSINFDGAVVGSFVKVDDLAFAGTVGMDEQADRTSLLVFPSPGTDVLNISTAESGELRLMDATGRMVLRSRVNGPAATLDVSTLAPGLFTYQFIGRDGQACAVGRWVKE